MKADGDDEAVSQSKPRMDFMLDWDINAMVLLLCECVVQCDATAMLVSFYLHPLHACLRK